MIISRRQLEFPSLDAGAARLTIHHRFFMLRVVAFRGGIVEDRLFEASHLRSTSAEWPLLTLTLGGNVVVRDGATAIEAERGELVWLPRGSGFRARSSETGTHALVLQWNPQVLGPLACAGVTSERLQRSDFDGIQGAIGRIVAGEYHARRVAAAVAELFTALHRLGLVDERPTPDSLWTPVADDVVRTGAVMDRVLSNLGANPMSTDLEASLGRSASHTRRLVSRYCHQAGCEKFVNWRHQRNLWRMYMGALLMTSARAETDAVAHLLGYGSATAFCRAFASAGLPSPGNIRHVVRQLT
jgi:hypothetical protein